MRKKGFSITEVIISVFVIVVGLVAILGLITSSIRESYSSRNRIIASQLAQEGVELIRNVRDSNVASSASGGAFAYFPAVTSSCRVDKTYTYPANIPCSAGDYLLNLDASGYYVHSAGTATFFRRKVVIADHPAIANAKTTTAYVWWKNLPDFPSPCNSVNNCVYIEDVLTEHP